MGLNKLCKILCVKLKKSVLLGTTFFYLDFIILFPDKENTL